MQNVFDVGILCTSIYLLNWLVYSILLIVEWIQSETGKIISVFHRRHYYCAVVLRQIADCFSYLTLIFSLTGWDLPSLL